MRIIDMEEMRSDLCVRTWCLLKVKTALHRVRGHPVLPDVTVTRLQSTKTQFSFLPNGKIWILGGLNPTQRQK